LLNKQRFNIDSAKHNEYLDAVMEFVIDTGQPMRLFNTNSFIRMLATFDNRFKLPSRNQVSNEIIVKQFDKFKE
jgi:hypothetical protein